MSKVFRDRLGSTGTIEDGEFVAYESQEEADAAVPEVKKPRLIVQDDEDEPQADQVSDDERDTSKAQVAKVTPTAKQNTPKPATKADPSA